MTGSRHVHEIYIRATPDQIWHALTDPDATRHHYFGLTVASDWEPGGDYEYLTPDGSAAIGGEILHIDPPRRLVTSFSMLFDPVTCLEPPSRVTWEIRPVGDACRLTLLHTELALSPTTWRNTATGWPVILSSVKTLLETGRPLGEIPDDGRSPHAPDGDTDLSWHRAQAVEANNGVYELLADAGSSADHDDRIIHQAHAAAYHWGIAGQIEHRARAEYLCSRAAAFVGRPEAAIHHAERCRDLVAEAGLADWDLAFAHEAMARALACSGALESARRELATARRVPIADSDDRAVFEAELVAGPWFGLDPVAPD